MLYLFKVKKHVKNPNDLLCTTQLKRQATTHTIYFIQIFTEEHKTHKTYTSEEVCKWLLYFKTKKNQNIFCITSYTSNYNFFYVQITRISLFIILLSRSLSLSLLYFFFSFFVNPFTFLSS